MSIITCPNCKIRVLPKSDDTCPSCGVSLLQKEGTPPATPPALAPIKKAKADSSPKQPGKQTSKQKTRNKKRAKSGAPLQVASQSKGSKITETLLMAGFLVLFAAFVFFFVMAFVEKAFL